MKKGNDLNSKLSENHCFFVFASLQRELVLRVKNCKYEKNIQALLSLILGVFFIHIYIHSAASLQWFRNAYRHTTTSPSQFYVQLFFTFILRSPSHFYAPNIAISIHIINLFNVSLYSNLAALLLRLSQKLSIGPGH